MVTGPSVVESRHSYWRSAKFLSPAPWVVVSQHQALLFTIRKRSFDDNRSSPVAARSLFGIPPAA